MKINLPNSDVLAFFTMGSWYGEYFAGEEK
jgi:hypothetical protein